MVKDELTARWGKNINTAIAAAALLAQVDIEATLAEIRFGLGCTDGVPPEDLERRKQVVADAIKLLEAASPLSRWSKSEFMRVVAKWKNEQ